MFGQSLKMKYYILDMTFSPNLFFDHALVPKYKMQLHNFFHLIAGSVARDMKLKTSENPLQTCELDTLDLVLDLLLDGFDNVNL